MKTSLLKKALAGVSPLTRRFVRRQGEFAVRLHDLMAESGLSQRQLAEKMGKKESYVSRVLSGSVNPTLKTMVEFEVALGHEIIAIPYEGKAVLHQVSVPQWEFPATALYEEFLKKCSRAGEAAHYRAYGYSNVG